MVQIPICLWELIKLLLTLCLQDLDWSKWDVSSLREVYIDPHQSVPPVLVSRSIPLSTLNSH